MLVPYVKKSHLYTSEQKTKYIIKRSLKKKKEVTKLKIKPSGWVLLRYDWCFLQQEEIQTQTRSKAQACGGTGRSRPSANKERGLQKSPADTLIMNLQPQDWETVGLLFKPPGLWFLVTAAFAFEYSGLFLSQRCVA